MAVLISLVVPLYNKVGLSRLGLRAVVDDSRKAGELALALLRGKVTEHFYLVCLDTHKRLICSELMNEGSPDEASVNVRQVVEVSLRHGAVYVILAHNHPSGVLTASKNDIEATAAVVKALGTVSIRVLDHLIVAWDDYLSMSEKRLLGLGY
jgi:DNA repair protein RadC